jgi:hypothetical protein
MLNIIVTDFSLIVSDSKTDDDGYNLAEAVQFGLSDGGTLRCSPDEDACRETLASKIKSLNGGSLVFADSVECAEEDRPWLDWARECLTEANQEKPLDPNELVGDIEGGDDEEVVVESEVGEIGEVKIEAGGSEVVEDSRPKHTRAGSKKPWEVNGWVDGRVLSTVKSHRKYGWGRCEYRVLCLPDGAYRLIFFAGNRDDMEVGMEWSHAQAMFRSLLGQDLDENTIVAGCGRRQGTRMTIRQFFGDSRRKKSKK